jgi:hypothetical protein
MIHGRSTYSSRLKDDGRLTDWMPDWPVDRIDMELIAVGMSVSSGVLWRPGSHAKYTREGDLFLP